MSELVGSYLSREDFVSDTDFAIAQLKRFTDAMEQVAESKKSIGGASSFNGVAEAAEIGVKANAQLVQSAKAVISIIDKRFASEAKLVTIQTDYVKQTAANNLELQKQTKELKDQIAYNNANTGSIEKARAAVRLLNTERNQLNLYTAEGKARQAELNAQIDKYNGFIKKSVDQLSQQKINIGNYQGSAKIIVDALEKEKIKLQSLTTQYQSFASTVQNARTIVGGFAGQAGAGPTAIAGGGPVSPPINVGEVKIAEVEMAKLEKQIEQTRNVVEGFSRVTEQPKFLDIAGKVGDASKEVGFFTKQLVDLQVNGLGDSDGAIALTKHIAGLKDTIGHTKDEIKALSSDTRGFDLFADSVTFAADSFQVMAGAAALAGASEEDVAETTKDLVAIQSVANGVKGIANELTTQGTAANKLYAFAQRQVAIAMDASATGAARLKAAMATVGFGLAIIAIGLLIANLSKIKDALSGATTATKAYDETLGEYQKAAKDAIEQTNKVKVAFDQAREGTLAKKDALKIYNDTLGDTFGKAKTLAEAEDLYTKKAAVYIQVMGMKAQANALFAKSAEITANAMVAANKDQVTVWDEFKQSLEYESFFSGVSAEQRAVIQAKKVKDIKDGAQKDSQDLQKLGEKIAGDAAKLATDNKLDLVKDEKPEKAKKKDDTKLKDALDAEKKRNAAIRALAIENANEIIRINQAVVDSDASSFKDKLKSLDEINAQKKILASIDFTAAVESEAKIEKHKRIEVAKSQDEILAAKTKFANSSKAIDDETTKNQVAAQKAANAKVIAEYAKLREAKLKELDASTQAERDKANADYVEAIIGLNDRLEAGTISQEKYNKKRTEIEIGFHIESLQREIEYQKNLLKIIELPDDKRAEALKNIADLEMQLSDATKDHHVKNEQEKLDATLNVLQKVQDVANTVFAVIDGLLNANEIGEKNRVKSEQDEAEKKAARDIELITQSGEAEETKAAKVTQVNARLQAQKDQFAQREKQAELERARFQKATNIFNIVLSTAQAVVKQLAATPLPYGAPFVAAVAALGAAQLAVAIRTPIPKFYRGKSKGQAYEGPAIVNDHPDGKTMEVIERADGSIEMPGGRNVITHVGANDIVHPSKEQWVEQVLNAAYRDARRMMRTPSARQAEDMEAVMKKSTKDIVTAINNKPEFNLGATDRGMVALMKWGANQVKYINENTNW